MTKNDIEKIIKEAVIGKPLLFDKRLYPIIAQAIHTAQQKELKPLLEASKEVLEYIKLQGGSSPKLDEAIKTIAEGNKKPNTNKGGMND